MDGTVDEKSERTYAAVVLRWVGTAVPDRSTEPVALRALVEELCRYAVEVVVLDHEPGDAAARQLDAHPVGPGGVQVRSDDDVVALQGILDDLDGRGIGPQLVLAVVNPAYEPDGSSVVAQSRDRGLTVVPVDGHRSTERVLRAQCERHRHGLVPAVDEDPAWVISLPPEVRRRRVDETLLTLANEGIGTRGTPEEDGPGTTPSVLVAGVYAGRETDQRLLPGPLWTAVTLSDAPSVGGLRLLDLRTGVVVRRDRVLGLTSLRFVSRARPGVAALRIEHHGTALAAAQPVVLPSATPGRTGRVDAAHWARVVSAEGGGVVVAAAQQRRSHRGTHSLERIAAVVGETHRTPTTAGAIRSLASARKTGFPALLAEHRAAWARTWSDAQVDVPDDPGVQIALRFALFHLLSTVSSTGEAAVGARGVSGDGYAGHVFWDSDVFVLPVLAAVRPAAARAMLAYRLHRLPAARLMAQQNGYAGARFPWESAHDGTDVTPRWVVTAGEMLPIRTGQLEEHIVADVAWAAWHYSRWSGDEDFLRGDGLPLLVETARYWASRIRRNADGRGHLYGVIGPDEYHEPVDDNAFTNVMARWNLRCAASLVAALDDDELRREAHGWLDIAEALVDGFDPRTGLYEQFAGYFDLRPLLLTDIATPPVAADLLLGHEVVEASQVIKQPDVLMLHHLVPDEAGPGSLVPNLDFYGPRTAHGSSLAPAIHASLLARAGRVDEALSWLRIGCRLDLDDLTGMTASGLHLATLGGVWQAVAFGMLGLREREGALMVDPKLPAQWRSLTLRMRFRGRRVRVAATPDEVVVQADRPLPVGGTCGSVVTAGRVVLRREGTGWAAG